MTTETLKKQYSDFVDSIDLSYSSIEDEIPEDCLKSFLVSLTFLNNFKVGDTINALAPELNDVPTGKYGGLTLLEAVKLRAKEKQKVILGEIAEEMEFIPEEMLSTVMKMQQDRYKNGLIKAYIYKIFELAKSGVEELGYTGSMVINPEAISRMGL
jgi:hypothetical protein